MITWIEHTTPERPVTGSGSSGPGGEIKAAASGRSNSAEEVAAWEAAGVSDGGSSDRLAPEDRKGPRTKIRNPF